VLTRRQKYDHRNADRYELKLIRVGHAVWAMYKRDRATLGIPLSEIQALYAACERVWRLKREYRAELRERLAYRSAEVAARFRKAA
jgi:hypothetical protein